MDIYLRAKPKSAEINNVAKGSWTFLKLRCCYPCGIPRNGFAFHAPCMRCVILTYGQPTIVWHTSRKLFIFSQKQRENKCKRANFLKRIVILEKCRSCSRQRRTNLVVQGVLRPKTVSSFSQSASAWAILCTGCENEAISIRFFKWYFFCRKVHKNTGILLNTKSFKLVVNCTFVQYRPPAHYEIPVV